MKKIVSIAFTIIILLFSLLGSVYCSGSTYESMISKIPNSSGVFINGYWQAGSSFSLTITNDSNFEFKLSKASLINGNSIVGSTVDMSLLSDGLLEPSESVGITFTLPMDLKDNVFSFVYSLTDISTGKDFEIEHEFKDVFPVGSTYYQDSDQDGYGNPNESLIAFFKPFGYVSDKTDCNDNDATIYPGATEIAGDGIDQDCNGADGIPIVNSITIKSDLSFKFSDAIYQSLTGDVNLWTDFIFFGDQGGKLLWELQDYGTAISTGNSITIASDLSFSIPNAIYQSLTGDINLETNFKYFGEQNGKLLWELDSYTVK